MLLLLLTGCWDKVTVDYRANLPDRTLTTTVHYWNAWPSTVGCEGVDAPTCAVKIRESIAKDTADLAEKGGVVTGAGATLRDGELDLVYTLTGPLDMFNEDHQGWEVVTTSSSCPLARPRERLSLTMEQADDSVVTASGRWRRVDRPDEDDVITTWIFRGDEAVVHFESDSGEGSEKAGPWTNALPGLEAALRAEKVWIEAP